MKLKFTFLLLISITISLYSCSDNQTKISYRIISEEKVETNNKAQLIEYAVYLDSTYSQEELKIVLLDIYDDYKDKDVFEKFDAPTVIGVNIYTSEDLAKNDKSSWIAMLSKYPNKNEPTFSFNDYKINSLQGLNDNEESKDEIALKELKSYLQERDLELCSLYKQLGDMELDCIHKADAKFPNFDYPEHINYSEKLMEEERKKILTNYNLADSIYTTVIVFGMSYCK